MGEGGGGLVLNATRKATKAIQGPEGTANLRLTEGNDGIPTEQTSTVVATRMKELQSSIETTPAEEVYNIIICNMSYYKLKLILRLAIN